MATQQFNLKNISIILIILALVTIGPSFLGLVMEADELQESDLIVVLMGGGVERMKYAADLYDDGYGNKIVMADNYQPSEYEKRLNTRFSQREVDIKKSAAVEIGIPERDIIILPGPVKNTREEAQAVRKYLLENEDIDSLIIISEPYYSYSAKLVFKWRTNNLGRDIRILSSPAASGTSDSNPLHIR